MYQVTLLFANNELTDLISSYIIQKILGGIDELSGGADSYKPISIEILTRLLNSLQFECSPVYECTLFTILFFIRILFILRIGEITRNRNMQRVINNDEVNVSYHSQSTYITIYFSKTDQKRFIYIIKSKTFN